MEGFLGGVALLIGLAILICLYFVPSIVAFRRNHSSKMGILVLNICLGWTFLGWVGSLVWALSGESRRM